MRVDTLVHIVKRAVSSGLGSLGYQLVKARPQEKPEDGKCSIQGREFAFISSLPGFLSRDAYDLLCKLSPACSEKAPAVLELGVFCGRSLLALGFAFGNVSQVIGVDPFYENFKNSPALEGEGEFLDQASFALTRYERIALLDRALKGSEEFRPGLSARLILRQMTQCSFFETKKDSERFDVVHVDREHTFGAVYEFLEQADRTLNYNSLVIIDDFLNPGFPGISEAVHTHSTYKKELFSVLYGFNKAVFVYRPQSRETSVLSDRLAAAYRADGKLVRPLGDDSIAVQ